MMNEALLDAIVDTDEKRRAYLTNARYHALIDNMVATIPLTTELLARGCTIDAPATPFEMPRIP